MHWYQSCYARPKYILTERPAEWELNLQLSNQGLVALLLSHCCTRMDFKLISNSVIPPLHLCLHLVSVGFPQSCHFLFSNVRLYLVYSSFFPPLLTRNSVKKQWHFKGTWKALQLSAGMRMQIHLFERSSVSPRGHYLDVIRILNIRVAEMKGRMRHLFCHQCSALHSSLDTRPFEQAFQVVTPSQTDTKRST